MALDLTPEAIDPSTLTTEAPFALRRRGMEGKIIIGDREPQTDRTLLCGGKPHGEIAAATRHSKSCIRTRTQPANLALERIIREPVPPDWDAQAGVYGFAQDPRHP
jgi:hypothetical protein